MSELISNRWYEVGDTQRLVGDGFFISYNPDTSQIGVDEATGIDMAGDEPRETALCREIACLILNGDWRQQYEDRVDEGWDACYQFYLAKKAIYGSTWSSDYDDGEQANDDH